MPGDGTTFSPTAGIAVYGNDVCVVGMEGSFAKYWKNVTSVDISNGSTLDQAIGISMGLIADEQYHGLGSAQIQQRNIYH